MNTTISRLLSKAIFLSGALFIGWRAQAQSTGTQPQTDTSHIKHMHREFQRYPHAQAPNYLRPDLAAGNDWGRGAGPRRSFGGHKSRIHYTPEQRKQVAAINKENRQKSADLFNNDNLTLKQYKAGLLALQKDRKAKMEGLLTQQQKDARAASARRRSENMQVMAAAHLERMKLRLDLTDDQVAKIRSGEENLHVQMKTLHENDNLLPQQKREQMRGLAEKHRDLVKSVLTTEQQTKFEQMMRRRPGDGRRGGFHGRGPGFRPVPEGQGGQPI
jgi:hypothetical protein